MADLKLEDAVQIIRNLQKAKVDPILYGSLGVSQYLGIFKSFNDIDLLVAPEWLHDDWNSLQEVMSELGFSLVDEHEHEFKNDEGLNVAFAQETVLTRDGILDSISKVIYVVIDNITIRTLTARDFLAAYRYSVKDGYRIESRGKKDAEIIALLEDYIAKQSG